MPEVERVIKRVRNLDSGDNERDMDHWIVERRNSKSDGYYSCAIKSGSMHFVSAQNGSIESWASPRRRVGLWNFDTQHISEIEVKVNGISGKETFLKYVRGYAYIYRQYEHFERLDFISRDRSIFEIEVRSEKKVEIEINLQVLHETAWPQSKLGNNYEVNEGDGCIEIKSNITSTNIHYRCEDKPLITVDRGKISLKTAPASSLGIYISCDGSEPRENDLEGSIKYNEIPNSVSNLVTPSFRINKLFKWSKHDLLELFTPTPIGDGFYAGIPQFSWFFGRDGEWMSMAAMECGMGELAESHLNLLYSFSKNGRIPHEIPLSNGGTIDGKNYFIGDSPISTQFMSIDSSPLWVICEYMLSAWSGKYPERERIKKVFEFCASCDRDGDGMLENRFSEGLIGWPESWAKTRDGICVEVNAWWLEAMRLFESKERKNGLKFEELLELYKKMFYRDNNGKVTVLDSHFNGGKREIKGAMQIVPAMYFKGTPFRESLEWLYRSDMVTEWGIRSVSNRDAFYDGGYHTGTIWPLMTGWMALALYNNSMHREGYNMIETFTRLAFSSLDPGRINETYNPESLYGEGQFFQGWSTSLFIQSIIEGLLGFERIPEDRDPSKNMKPQLPEEWEEVKLLNFPFRDSVYNITVKKGNKIEISDITMYSGKKVRFDSPKTKNRV